MKQSIFFCIVFSSLSLVISCHKAQPLSADAAAFYRGRDLAGREIILPQKPRRLISLAPSNTEIVFALGAGTRLQGITSVCDFPPEVNRIRRLGDLGRINLEDIVGLSPDLVLAGTKTDPEALAMLERLHIPSAVTEGTTFEETYASIIAIGKMTGTDVRAAALVASLRSEAAAVADRVKGARRPLCYYVVGFGEGGNWTAGPGSFIDEMITLGGGRNAAAGLGRPWGIFQLEKLIALDPEIILAGSHTGAPARLKSEPGYRDLSAVRQNRLLIINDDLVNRPGPRLVGGLREIARALHPELFSAGGNP
jgi:iron complex transport system substrate-binding protein